MTAAGVRGMTAAGVRGMTAAGVRGVREQMGLKHVKTRRQTPTEKPLVCVGSELVGLSWLS